MTNAFDAVFVVVVRSILFPTYFRYSSAPAVSFVHSFPSVSRYTVV